MTDTCEERCIHPDNVRKIREKALPADTVERLAETFKALGDATRARILLSLSRMELCVCDLSAVLGVSESLVSHQLRVLRNQRLVRSRKEGKVVYYSLDDDHIAKLLSQGLEHVQEVKTLG
jgi:ArsR family transcriptional regulator